MQDLRLAVRSLRSTPVLTATAVLSLAFGIGANTANAVRMDTCRRAFAPWLLLLVCTCGCIDRTRTNSTCEWTRDSAFPLDLANPDDQRHLVADGQLAEELAVRYADSEHKRQFGYEGH